MRLDIGNLYEWYKNPMTNYVSRMEEGEDGTDFS